MGYQYAMTKKRKLYELTPEHRAQLEPWAQKWIANAMNTAPLSDEEREIYPDAVRRLYAAANLPAPRVVFSSGPVTGGIAAAIASGVWYLREHPEQHQVLFGRKLSESDLMAAIGPACAFAVRSGLARLRGEPVAEVKFPDLPRAATAAATADATYDATRAATADATADATRAAIDAATADATYDATYDAIDAATYAATADATYDATYAATADATYDATADATADATRAATRAAIDDAIDDAIDAATADATYDATYDATADAIYAATYDATYDATADAIYAATADATRAATRAAIDDAIDDATADAIDDAIDAATADAIYAATADATAAAIDAATADATADAIYAATADAIYAATRAAPRAAIDDAIDDATADATRAATADATYDAIDVAAFLTRCARGWARLHNGGNQWSAWVAYISFFRHIAKLQIDYSKWGAYETLAACGPRYMHANFCILTERPERIDLDERRRPHRADGPSHVWRDGVALYHWHGMRVDRRLVESPETYTREEMAAEKNSEIHRALAERLGWERYLELRGIKVIDRWTDPKTGLDYELLEPRQRLGELEPRYLRMKSPPLHDGAQPWFVEPVDPGLQTAQAARKWQVQLSNHPDAKYYRHGDVVVIYAPRETLYWPTASECNENPHHEFVQEA